MKTKTRLALLLATSFVLPVATLMIVKNAGGADQNAASRPQRPCDVYQAAGTPCVTAHSSTRALYAAYTGPLYQVLRVSDNKTLDILVSAEGFANAKAQDAFCENTLCFITTIYDQSPKGNHLYPAPPGTFKGPDKGAFNTLPIADMAPITINGKKAYGVYIMPGMGFRNNDAKGLAINDEPEGMYFVVDGKHFDSGCCFDYGNASTNGAAVGTGTMETTYFGISTNWGSGNGQGPWIMADFEAGLFSGYGAKKNDVPSIESSFVSAFVNGGGGNKWDLRGGDAQKGELTTYYSGVRPGSQNNNAYFPMNKKGAVLMGNGGDNGNGSSGTFFEGVMTVGYPTDAAINAVQANIVAAKYDVPAMNLSRALTFTPQSTQEITFTFTNTTAVPILGVNLQIDLPAGWAAVNVKGAVDEKQGPLAPGASKSETFKITSPTGASAGFMTAKAVWDGGSKSEIRSQRVRSAPPVKINEVRLTGQFIELYNASDKEVDLSNWSLINTQSQWAPVKLATIPNGTKIAPKGYYLLGQSGSGLAAPASAGDDVILVSSVAGIEADQEVTINGEKRKVAKVGSAASPMTTVFIPISTGPWLTIPVGAKNIPVTSAAGFEVGQKVGIDLGGNFEINTVVAVGKAATQTTLAAEVKAGDAKIKLASVSNLTVGDTLTIGTGQRKELAVVKSITPGAAPAAPARRGGAAASGTPGEVELAAPLKIGNMTGVDVSSPGTGITLESPTKFQHKSGDALQPLGGGVTLDQPLNGAHEYGSAIVNPKAPGAGYSGTPQPAQWFGGALSNTAGSIALMDASGKVVVDAIVYGSQQTNSSANGTIASPDLATLEGEQKQGGCIAIAPSVGRGGRAGASPAPATPARSMARIADGVDADNLCKDFQLQTSTPGAANQAP